MAGSQKSSVSSFRQNRNLKTLEEKDREETIPCAIDSPNKNKYRRDNHVLLQTKKQS